MAEHIHHYSVKGGQSARVLFGSINYLREMAAGRFEWRHCCEVATYYPMFVSAEVYGFKLVDTVWLHHC